MITIIEIDLRRKRHLGVYYYTFLEFVEDDGLATNTITLTLSGGEFDEYKTRGYLRGIKYTWTEQNGVYKVYIPQSSYDMLGQNMESAGL